MAHSLPLLLKKKRLRDRLIGKWHLDYRQEFSPSAHGFDLFFSYKSAAIDYYTHFTTRPSEGAQFTSAQPDLWENDTPTKQDGYITDLITRKNVEFFNQNATRPFFIDVAFNAPHKPTQRPDNPVQDSASSSATRADYSAVMERVDRGAGDILQALRKRAWRRIRSSSLRMTTAV